LGIDAVRYYAHVQTKPPPYPLGWQPPSEWSGLQTVALIAATILLVSLFRGWLNYVYAVASGVLIHKQIVVDLRAAVYGQLQRLSFRFFDSNATGSIINRVTSDVQSVRAFVDGVIIQLVILILSLICYLVYMLSINVRVTLVCLATTPVLWFLTVLFSRIV